MTRAFPGETTSENTARLCGISTSVEMLENRYDSPMGKASRRKRLQSAQIAPGATAPDPLRVERPFEGLPRSQVVAMREIIPSNAERTHHRKNGGADFDIVTLLPRTST